MRPSAGSRAKCEFDREPARVHRLGVNIDWEHARRGRRPRIIVETDNPEQERVELGVLIIPD